MDARDEVVEVNGARLRCALQGSGPAVVFLHAGIADMRMWEKEAAHLGGRYTVLRYDARGFGGSTLPPGPYSAAEDLTALLDHFGIARAALVGCSMGGGTALDLAVERPERVGALVLIGPSLAGHDWSEEIVALDDREEAAFERRDAAAVADINVATWVIGRNRNADEVDVGVVELAREMILAACAVQMAAYDASVQPGPPRRADPPVSERLAAIAAPTAVVVGSHDLKDVHEIADLVVERVPAAEKHTIGGAAHLPNLERPDLFASFLDGFLARAGGAREPRAPPPLESAHTVARRRSRWISSIARGLSNSRSACSRSWTNGSIPARPPTRSRCAPRTTPTGSRR